MYESKKQPLLPKKEFKTRVVRHVAMAWGIIAASLGVGVLGYHFIAELTWIDALLDASMILGGMGPVSNLHTDSAKIFASAYALFSGLAFIGIIGLVLAPFAHRILHRFHIEDVEVV